MIYKKAEIPCAQRRNQGYSLRNRGANITTDWDAARFE